MITKPNCAHCGCVVKQSWSAINRARKIGAPIYCDRQCSGLGRRRNKTREQKKKEKREYDILYRVNNKESLKVKKAESFRLTYSPSAAAIKRKTRRVYHLEYCRKPKYREKKRDYDQVHRVFGTVRVPQEFKELVKLQTQLKKEIKDAT